MSALNREWINDQAERVTLEAPELRPVGQVSCVPTRTGLLIGCNYRRPMPQPSAASRLEGEMNDKTKQVSPAGWGMKQRGFYDLNVTGFLIACLIVGVAIGIAIAYLVPWLWSFIKPLIHAITA